MIGEPIINVYVVYEVNSQELEHECGKVEVKKIFSDYENAKNYVENELINEEYDNFKVCECVHYSNHHIYSLYQNGNEDSPIWFEIHIEKKLLL